MSEQDSEKTMVGGKGADDSSGALRRYSILKTLGKGAMGVVHLAHDTVLERDVAVKELHPHLAEDSELMDRFRLEAKVLAKMAHPGVVQVYDFVEAGGHVWIVMEFVRGRELADILKEQGPLPIEEAARIGSLMADALAYAHSIGIVHRDFKPANVLVTESGTPKIMDFGLAKLLESAHQTMAGTILGSPAYMSPEQAAGKSADPRSDVYALGIVLYRMVTGKVPFEGDLASVLAQHINKQAPSPSILRPDLPQAFDSMILAMLAKDPASRPQSMLSVANELRLFKEGTHKYAAERTMVSPAERTMAPSASTTIAAGEPENLEALLQQKQDLDKMFKEKFTKTVTVMFTDLKGSTTIAETEGDFSSRMLIQDHNNIVFPLVAEHQGILVKTMGDGTMSYFESAQMALRAAAKMQQGFERYNLDKKPRVPILIRIGLHTGPCIIEKNDIFGDTVNTASRFESSANPGEINVSEDTYNALTDKNEIPCKFVKTTRLKGKTTDSNVYKAYWNPTEYEKEIVAKPAPEVKPSNTKWIIIGAVILIIIAALLIPMLTKKEDTGGSRSLKHTTTP